MVRSLAASTFASVLALTGCGIDTAGRASPDDAAETDVDATVRPTDASGQDSSILDAGPPSDSGSPEIDAGSDAGPPPELDTLRWELACGAVHPTSDWLCETENDVEHSTTMRGADGVVYDVTIRVRGVIEEKTILGGTSTGHFTVGGSAQSDAYTEAGLAVTDPAGTYWLNSGSSSGTTCVPLDYEATISIRTGATVRIWGATSNDWSNRNFDDEDEPIVIDGIPPAPNPFNGQFVQVDATALVPSP